jgi:hypothetical protein
MISGRSTGLQAGEIRSETKGLQPRLFPWLSSPLTIKILPKHLISKQKTAQSFWRNNFQNPSYWNQGRNSRTTTGKQPAQNEAEATQTLPSATQVLPAPNEALSKQHRNHHQFPVKIPRKTHLIPPPKFHRLKAV